MSNVSEKTMIRGSVQVEISTSTDGLVAGESFSIFVKVHNPFEVPIEIDSIRTILPINFMDMNAYQEEEGGDSDSQKIDGDSSLPLELSSLFKDNSVNYAKQSHIVAFDIGGTHLSITPEIDQEMKGATKSSNPEKGKGSMETKSAIKVLQPGNTTTQIFTLKTRCRIWFQPSSYKFNIEIQYKILDDVGDAKYQYDTKEYTIQIKASLYSVITGAMIGGVCGWFLSDKPKQWDLITGSHLITSLLLAAISVVLLSRKKDVQPIVTIEDIWGGIAAGFLVTYAGSDLLENLTSSNGIEHNATTPDVNSTKAS
jgi:hypothetical protein